MTMLSIVIPAYNEERGIADIVDRVLMVGDDLAKVGVDKLELLVVDDGSQDRTAEIASSVEGVRLIRAILNGAFRILLVFIVVSYSFWRLYWQISLEARPSASNEKPPPFWCILNLLPNKKDPNRQVAWQHRCWGMILRGEYNTFLARCQPSVFAPKTSQYLS